MNSRKEAQRKALLNRLDEALSNLYHNASPHHPYQELSEDQWRNYYCWFEDVARFEIEYIQDGGPYPHEESINSAWATKKYPRPSQMAARVRFVQHNNRKRLIDMARPGGMFRPQTLAWGNIGATREIPYVVPEGSYTFPSNDLWCRISEYGKLYQWGRGGRTLAPEGLIRTGGGSSFSIRPAEDHDDDYEALVELCMIVESFNAYVKTWCSRDNLEGMWKDYRDAEAEETIHEAEMELAEAGYFA